MSDEAALQTMRAAESHLDARRLTLALKEIGAARELASSPQLRAYTEYNRGSILYAQFGDGVGARATYANVAAEFDAAGYGPEPNDWRRMHMYALENAMLCSLSYEEFETFAARLARLDPKANVLVGLLPQVRERHARGRPWSDELLYLAGTFYSTDPKEDRGSYGQAKSAYHLILANRRLLRVGRLDWTFALEKYIALAQRMLADCVDRRGSPDRYPVEEYSGILADTLPYCDEYLAASNHERITALRSDSLRMLEATANKAPTSSGAPRKNLHHRCHRCGAEINQPFDDCPACGAASGIRKAAGWTAAAALLAGGAGGYWLAGGAALWIRLFAALAGGAALAWIASSIAVIAYLAANRVENSSN